MNTRKPLKRQMGDTEYMLDLWGWWRMQGMGVPSYASPMLTVMRNVMPNTTRAFSITDELAVVVDAAVARLCKREQQMGDMLWLYYGAKWSAVRVGRHWKMSEGKARELIKAGVAWIDCVLEHLREDD